MVIAAANFLKCCRHIASISLFAGLFAGLEPPEDNDGEKPVNFASDISKLCFNPAPPGPEAVSASSAGQSRGLPELASFRDARLNLL